MNLEFGINLIYINLLKNWLTNTFFESNKIFWVSGLFDIMIMYMDDCNKNPAMNHYTAHKQTIMTIGDNVEISPRYVWHIYNS